MVKCGSVEVCARMLTPSRRVITHTQILLCCPQEECKLIITHFLGIHRTCMKVNIIKFGNKTNVEKGSGKEEEK